jgi:hypothetical protein
MTKLTPPLPLPRPAINQGIDPENNIVTSHTETYSNLLSQIDSSISQLNPIVALDPYGTAPLSLYIGLWSQTEESVTINVVDENQLAPVLQFTQPVTIGTNLIPVAGLLANTINLITLTSSHLLCSDSAPAPYRCRATLRPRSFPTNHT